jgi:hypothetical protein
LPSKSQSLLQLPLELRNRATSEHPSFGDEEGKEQVNVLLRLHIGKIKREAIGTALDLLYHFVNAFVLLTEAQAFVKVVGEAET